MVRQRCRTTVPLWSRAGNDQPVLPGRHGRALSAPACEQHLNCSVQLPKTATQPHPCCTGVLRPPRTNSDALSSQNCCQPGRLPVQVMVMNDGDALDHSGGHAPGRHAVCRHGCKRPVIDPDPIEIDQCSAARSEIGDRCREIGEFSICHRAAKAGGNKTSILCQIDFNHG